MLINVGKASGMISLYQARYTGVKPVDVCQEDASLETTNCSHVRVCKLQQTCECVQ